VRRAALLACAAALALSGAAAAKTILPGFRSPSKNITCFYMAVQGGLLQCQIAQADYAKKLTAYCNAPPIGVDWGGFSLGPTKKGLVGCTGGTLYDPGTQRIVYITLPYGKKWRRGPFTCLSQVTGVTCRNRAGHGLFISRESYRVF
jgi:hypothetical protein